MGHITINIAADNAGDLAEAIMDLAKNLLGNADPVVPELKAEAASRAPRKTKEEPKAEAAPKPDPTPEPTRSPQPDPEPAPSGAAGGADAPTVAYDDVRKAVIALAAAKGREAVLDVLTLFEVDHASKLPEGQWGDALAALKAALVA